MMLCRHNWYTHASQFGNSLRHKMFVGEMPLPAFAICFGLGMALGNVLGAPWYVSIGAGIPVGVAFIIIYAMFLDYFYGFDDDPWKTKDESCLKCGKMKLDYTKWLKKYRKKAEALRVKDANKARKAAELAKIRENDIKEATAQYNLMLELYK